MSLHRSFQGLSDHIEDGRMCCHSNSALMVLLQNMEGNDLGDISYISKKGGKNSRYKLHGWGQSPLLAFPHISPQE